MPGWFWVIPISIVVVAIGLPALIQWDKKRKGR
jgi:nitrogen fixation-related uncharacterized protein